MIVYAIIALVAIGAFAFGGAWVSEALQQHAKKAKAEAAAKAAVGSAERYHAEFLRRCEW